MAIDRRVADLRWWLVRSETRCCQSAVCDRWRGEHPSNVHFAVNCAKVAGRFSRTLESKFAFPVVLNTDLLFRRGYTMTVAGKVSIIMIAYQKSADCEKMRRPRTPYIYLITDSDLKRVLWGKNEGTRLSNIESRSEFRFPIVGVELDVYLVIDFAIWKQRFGLLIARINFCEEFWVQWLLAIQENWLDEKLRDNENYRKRYGQKKLRGGIRWIFLWFKFWATITEKNHFPWQYSIFLIFEPLHICYF